MIECKIVKRYETRSVLEIEKSFEEGKIYTIIGNNGCGKSTFLNALSGQIPFEGAVKGAKNVIQMPQSTYNFDFSVKKNVLLFVAKKNEEKRKKAEEMLQEIGLTALSKKNARTLSGGEGQKTALLRTILQESDVLLLDEPTSSMDISSTLIAEKLIQDYKKETNCTVFIVTHSVSQAERLADEILFFDNGKLIESGKNIISDPQSDALKIFLRNR